MPYLIGMSGWHYAHWKETFYPKGVPQRSWLEFYSERYQTVEVNNAFYRLPEKKTFEAWRDRTPEDFIVTVKVSRYLTHIKRLKESEEPVGRFMERAVGLGPKLGPVLLQLPPTLKIDLASLDETLTHFGGRVRVAVEFRHPTWFVEETRALLTEHDAALCWADREAKPIAPLWRTAPWGYLRFHEGLDTPPPCYEVDTLRAWIKRLSEVWVPSDDVFVYFNNDPRGCALRDAYYFAEEAAAAGVPVTRTAHADEITVT